MNGQEYLLTEINNVRTNPIGLKIAKISGGVLTGGGGLLTAFGVYLIIAGFSLNECGAFIAVALGAAFGIGGLAVVIVGGIPLLIGEKKFELETKWNLGTAYLVREGRKKTLEPILFKE